ncbi:hypothetical protein C8D76_106102 [Pasteurella langaaensis DSM 22999]|uniref:Esterase n=1 Tax=Alitibacter langaaensis DSM 22999 TaxID=1122935 RepID=A0A2U0T6N7_9PAST|nr:alpha/beta fold hydrolase [Pasteurella langaaensis]PVX39280.1 hypothetical protein C8D76_106102 [Pasteurella langaaensis DSM 22999]
MQKRVFITHGYTANSQKHWFQWLKVRLEKEKFLVTVLDMPNSNHPNVQEWLDYHASQIGELYPTDIFIGHSLGCIATLRFLAARQQKIAAAILVSGFNQPLPNLPELDGFSKQPLDYNALIAQISQRTVISSLDDDVVNHAFTEQLATDLQAKYIATNGYRHFTERQGVTELPLLLDEILALAS